MAQVFFFFVYVKLVATLTLPIKLKAIALMTLLLHDVFLEIIITQCLFQNDFAIYFQKVR